jgi:muramoyltetrapeptide carboxypeptidase
MIDRRRLLAAAGLAMPSLAAGAQRASKSPTPAPAAAAASRPLVKPKALKPGDTVGLIAPASYMFDIWRLEEAAARVESMGLVPKLGKHVKNRRGFFAGTDAERLEDFHAMFRDPQVKGVFCLQGGYGTPRLLDGIDYELVRNNPKVLLGYSDITGLHLAVLQKAGLVTFHGPTLGGRIPARPMELLKRALFVPEPLGELANPPEDDPVNPLYPLHTIVPGTARGRLTGGNLTLVSVLMGTPYEIETRGRILLLEDTGEAPYRVDRMLVQLKLAGKLSGAAGTVWGTCDECDTSLSSFAINLSLSEILDEIVGGAGKPAMAGLFFGHERDKVTVPLGVEAELDAAGRKLVVTEAATVA